MCGIAGFIYRDRSYPASQALVAHMCDQMVHRGPDGDGYFVQGHVALGMRRLAIIDLEGGAQPVFNVQQSLVIVFNGEIYNYIELRHELEALGHRFRTKSDTEVIVQAYEAWGVNCLTKFNGMFAFALWDARAQELLLVRDRLGVKPLHYAIVDEKVLFGSEIKSLLAGGVSEAINWEVCDAYLALGYVPTPHSFYKHIQKLRPGHFLRITPDAVSEHQYWDIALADEHAARRDEMQIVEEFQHLLRDAVRLRMRSDVPFGAFLSGGLDSSTIVALMSEQTQVPVETFTIGFEQRAFDERTLARSVAHTYHTNHHEQLVQRAQMEQVAQHLGRSYDEPFGDSSAIPTYLVSQLARTRVTVVLTGDGGDELLAGYPTYQRERIYAAYRRLPETLTKLLIPAAALAGRTYAPRALQRAMSRVATMATRVHEPFSEQVLERRAWLPHELRRKLLARLAEEGVRVRPAIEYIEDVVRQAPAASNFQVLNYVDFKLALPDDMLTKVDRASMAVSLEARNPFLDFRLVELLARVHPNVKLAGYQRKHILRRAYGHKLPRPLLAARKRGFGVPLREWFSDPDCVFVHQLLSRNTQLDLFDDALIGTMLTQHRAGAWDYGQSLWVISQLLEWVGRTARVAA